MKKNKINEIRHAINIFISLHWIGKIAFILFILLGAIVVGYIQEPKKMTEIYETLTGVRPQPSELSNCERFFWDDIRNTTFDDGSTPTQLAPEIQPVQLMNEANDSVTTLRCNMRIIFQDGHQETLIAERILDGLQFQISLIPIN
jgi:hypothetical protein